TAPLRSESSAKMEGSRLIIRHGLAGGPEHRDHERTADAARIQRRPQSPGRRRSSAITANGRPSGRYERSVRLPAVSACQNADIACDDRHAGAGARYAGRLTMPATTTTRWPGGQVGATLALDRPIVSAKLRLSRRSTVRWLQSPRWPYSCDASQE